VALSQLSKSSLVDSIKNGHRQIEPQGPKGPYSEVAGSFDHFVAARPSKAIGKASPSALAVLRLSSSSIFVDNGTVKSDGFSSLRMQRSFQVTT
jgi:hypothetical protein